MFPKSFAHLPYFFFFQFTMWQRQSHQPFMKTDLAPCWPWHIFCSDHQKEGGAGKKCGLSRANNGETGAQEEDSQRSSALCRPLGNLPRLGVAIMAITWESAAGCVSVAFPAGQISVSISHRLLFQQNLLLHHPRWSLIKIIIPGLCFCPSFSRLTERHPNYKFPSLPLPQVHCPESCLLI